MFVSTGTIHLKIKEEKRFVLFVPDENHRVNYQGKEYAVFLPDDLGTAESSCKAVKGIIGPIKKYLNSIKLELNNSKISTELLLDAAMQRSKVDVVIAKCKADSKEEEGKADSKNLKLIGITVPALSGK